MALSDYQTLATDQVRDDAGKVSADQRDSAIGAAVERYSQDRPRQTCEDLTNVSGTLIDLPAGWQADFSVLSSLEHPVGRVPPVLIEPDRWATYLAPAGMKIMLLDGLAAGSSVRATYTVRHVVSAQADTIPLGHREAVAKLAAASLCDQLAAFYANETDSTMGADRALGQSKSQAYAARARDYRKQYQDAVGVQDKRAAPAGAVAQLKSRDSLGQPRFFHPARSAR